MDNNQIYHHGILGMKWGVRRTEKQLARARGKRGAEDTHDDYKNAHSGKSMKSMSNQELKNVNQRLQMEQQYSQLTQKKVSAGRKFVTGVLVGAASSIATSYATKYMKKGIEYVASGKAAAGAKKAAAAVTVARQIKKGSKAL